MTLPSSGPISLSQVNVELGRSSTALISLGEAAVRSLAGVPSGPISMSDLYGKSAFTLGFDANFSLSSEGTQPSDEQASFTLGTNATASASADFISAAATRWGSPTTAGIGSSYEVRLEVSSLSVEPSVPTLVQFAGVNITTTGNTAYYALSSARSLVVQATTNPQVGSSQFTQVIGTIRIREIANPANVTTATFTLTADADL